MLLDRREGALEEFGRSDFGKLHLRDEIAADDVGVLELLIEMMSEQLHGILELALAVAQRDFAKLADHNHRADDDRHDQKGSAQDQPQHRTPPGNGAKQSARPGAELCNAVQNARTELAHPTTPQDRHNGH